MNRTITALCTAALLATGFAGSASAEEIDIKYQDLDLSSQKGQAELDRRIDAAARDFYGFDDLRTGTRMRQTAKSESCLKETRPQIAAHFEKMIAQHRKGG